MLSAVVLESNPRKVCLWNRADFDKINNKVLDYCSYFVSQYTMNTTIEVLWASFKSFCMECLDLMPHKFYKVSSKHSWINSYIKGLAKKKRQLCDSLPCHIKLDYLSQC